MIESVSNLVIKLGNSFTNLEEQEKECMTLKEKLEQYEKMLNFINGNAKRLNKYEDQSLILDAIKEIKSTPNEYEAACYLLDSNDDSVMILPQYRNSKTYLDTIINYMKMIRDSINDRVLELDKECSTMQLNKKYYQILNEDSPFVLDIDEFLGLLEREESVLEERNVILSYIIKNNVDNYLKRIKGEEK